MIDRYLEQADRFDALADGLERRAERIDLALLAGPKVARLRVLASWFRDEVDACLEEADRSPW